jgi:hypothetical protein
LQPEKAGSALAFRRNHNADAPCGGALLAGSLEPKTIQWSEAIAKFASAGHEQPERELVRAIINNEVGYYPRRALDLERFHRQGLLDAKTGLLRMHARDVGTSIRPILTDVELYLFSKETDVEAAKVVNAAVEILRPASNSQIERAISAVYDGCKKTGDKSPNINELVAPVQLSLKDQQLQASGRRIKELADAPKYKALRRKPGKTLKQEKRGQSR